MNLISEPPPFTHTRTRALAQASDQPSLHMRPTVLEFILFVCVQSSQREKESASPAGGPAVSTPLCSIEESRAALPGTDQLERGGEVGEEGREWKVGVASHYDLSGAINCLIYSIKVIRLVILFGSFLCSFLF